MKAILLLGQKWPAEEAEQSHRKPRGARSIGGADIMSTLYAQANGIVQTQGNDNENHARPIARTA